MGHLDAAAVWGVPMYLERDASLPDMGRSPLGPVPLTRRYTDAILACDDVAAVAELKAYARSYVGVAGMALVSSVATIAFGLAGRRGATAGAAVTAIMSGSVVLEARRRARQWEAIADARLAAGPISR
ncbi:hypothetical protein [Demequina muriae]|uniref:Uncharacterized protein n=1 Tax=Demequina muriae TaxID=3051664 RepID=A0ABT8GJH7_9MICO|nr:hypothetical protein [Demequina sp. EGI L300058]MDN4481582.1 hypothetical protein [Demequina sp. EGI L300058]